MDDDPLRQLQAQVNAQAQAIVRLGDLLKQAMPQAARLAAEGTQPQVDRLLALHTGTLTALLQVVDWLRREPERTTLSHQQSIQALQAMLLLAAEHAQANALATTLPDGFGPDAAKVLLDVAKALDPRPAASE